MSTIVLSKGGLTTAVCRLLGKGWLGASWVVDYRTGSSRWVWDTAKSLGF